MTRYIVKETGSSKKPFGCFDTTTGAFISKHVWRRFAQEAVDKLNAA